MVYMLVRSQRHIVTRALLLRQRDKCLDGYEAARMSQLSLAEDLEILLKPRPLAVGAAAQRHPDALRVRV